MSAFREQTRAALTALGPSLKAEAAEPSLLQTPLTWIGDGLRLRLDPGASIRAWLGGLERSTVEAVLGAQHRESATWTLPAPGTAADDDPALDQVIRRRDAADSIVASVTWWALRRSLAPVGLPAYATLLDALEAFDGRLAEVVSRADAEDRLGDRAELLGMQPWTRRLRDAADASSGVTATVSVSTAAIGDAVPDDAIVTEYAMEGRWHRVVEEAARRSPSFAEDLAGYIDTLLDENERVGFLARRWRQLAGSFRLVKPALQFDVVPGMREAAASEPVEIPSRSMRLGMLGDVPAEARLVCTPREATLYVFAEPGTIASVEFGEARVVAPDDRGDWVAKTTVREGTTTVRIVATSGAEFTADIALAPTVDG